MEVKCKRVFWGNHSGTVAQRLHEGII